MLIKVKHDIELESTKIRAGSLGTVVGFRAVFDYFDSDVTADVEAEDVANSTQALTMALDAAIAVLREIWRWNPQAIPTHVTVRGVEMHTSVIFEMAKLDLEAYGEYSPAIDESKNT